jgi:hypothetical protein
MVTPLIPANAGHSIQPTDPAATSGAAAATDTGIYSSTTYTGSGNNNSSAPMLLDIGVLLHPPYTIAAKWGRTRFLMLSMDTAWPTAQQLKAWTQPGANTQFNNNQVSTSGDCVRLPSQHCQGYASYREATI